MKQLWAYSLLVIFLALFSYCLFPLGPDTFLYFTLAVLLLLRSMRLERWRGGKAWLLAFGSVTLGVAARFFLEYGEAWWQRNFTVQNTLLYLLVVPLYIVALYHIAAWWEGRSS